jgi:hypothetical protein
MKTQISSVKVYILQGGIKSGNCANGFGNCCVFVVKTDTGTISNNCTYIQNSIYPTVKVAGAGTFTWNISPSTPKDICSLRIDFTDTVIISTAPLLSTKDRLVIQGPTGGTTNAALPRANPPLLAQDLTGHHIYVETGGSTTATTITITTLAATAAGTKWRFKVSQIACDSSMLPPNGCQQYHTGDTGTIMSLSYQSTKTSSQQELASQQFSTCIRKNKGFCFVSYTPTVKTGAPGTVTATSFIVGIIAGGVRLSNLGSDNAARGCQTAAWIAPGLVITTDSLQGMATGDGAADHIGAGNSFCGDAPIVAGCASSSDCAKVFIYQLVPLVQRPPFVSYHITDDAHNTAAVEGYSLDYHQVGCSGDSS